MTPNSRQRSERELEILTAIGEGRTLTQRVLAQRLGVALGLANLYLKRLVRKGLIKIADFPRKPHARQRVQYVLTPRGMAEKARLTYEYMTYSLQLFRRCRETLREGLSRLPDQGRKRIALHGTGSAAELAYLTLREFGLEPIGIFDARGGQKFLGFPVQDERELATADFDLVVLATFEPPERTLRQLAPLGIPASSCLTLRRLAAPSGLEPDEASAT